MVSSYLLIAVALCGPVGIVKSFQNGVLTEHLLDFQDSLLTAALLCKFGLFNFLLSFQFVIVSE